MRLTADAPAKINRELRVGRIRPDGFHEIRSRMVSISLADTLAVEDADGLHLDCDDSRVPAGSENIVVRAAESLARGAGIAPRARITLTKRVPMGGGLGGGSADAAIALRLLARLWDLRADVRDLAGVASELGSDVPFFLTGGEADVSGRGEIVEPLPDTDGPAAELLLLVPPFAISTAGVYRAHAGRFALPESLDVEDPGRREFLGPNDLASAVLEQEPRMEAYLDSAARLASDHVISGSGSTIVMVLQGAPGNAEAILAARHPDLSLHRCHTLTRDAFQEASTPHPTSTGGLR
jgi:4-diphosphocytidyl-2-C-methyl-D-erythritol kinase